MLARAIGVTGSMAAILNEAILPNLVQTTESTPAFVHGGPFANIAHGCNSILATRMALAMADYAVTEAGFAFDLGGEKFFDLKCRAGGFNPAAIVLVATVRALKMHGGVALDALKTSDPGGRQAGTRKPGRPPRQRRPFRQADGRRHQPVWVRHARGDRGRTRLLRQPRGSVRDGRRLRLGRRRCDRPGRKGRRGRRGSPRRPLEPLYPLDWPAERKIEQIARIMYGAAEVNILPAAAAKIRKAGKLGYGKLPICMAKTQDSLSDNPKLRGRPQGFTLTVRDIEIAAGAGFLVALTGDIVRMPGLPERPAAERIDVDDRGMIVGLA